jgi:hypothetical protein
LSIHELSISIFPSSVISLRRIGFNRGWCIVLAGVMINSQSMSLSQKQKFWREHKE